MRHFHPHAINATLRGLEHVWVQAFWDNRDSAFNEVLSPAQFEFATKSRTRLGNLHFSQMELECSQKSRTS